MSLLVIKFVHKVRSFSCRFLVDKVCSFSCRFLVDKVRSFSCRFLVHKVRSFWYRFLVHKVRSFSCRFLVDKVRSFSCRFRYVNKEQLRLQYLDDENTFVHLSEDAIALWLRCFDAPFMWRMLFLNDQSGRIKLSCLHISTFGLATIW